MSNPYAKRYAARHGSAGRAWKEGGMRLMLLVNPVGTFAALGLKDSTVYPAFFIAPAMKPLTVCFCQPILSMISARVAPFLRWSMATTDRKSTRLNSSHL